MNCSTLSWYLEMCVTKLCSTVRVQDSCISFKAHEYQDVQTLRGVNASVFFLMCSLKASPSRVPLGKQLVSRAAPGRDRERRCKF